MCNQGIQIETADEGRLLSKSEENSYGAQDQVTEQVTELVDVRWHAAAVDRDQRETSAGHRGCVIWFTGLSGSGKSTLDNCLLLL